MRMMIELIHGPILQVWRRKLSRIMENTGERLLQGLSSKLTRAALVLVRNPITFTSADCFYIGRGHCMETPKFRSMIECRKSTAIRMENKAITNHIPILRMIKMNIPSICTCRCNVIHVFSMIDKYCIQHFLNNNNNNIIYTKLK